MRKLGSSVRNQWQVDAERADLVRPALSAIAVSVVAQPQKVRLDLARTALVVIDMQNDFCHPQGWLASIGVDVAPLAAPVEPLSRVLPVLRGSSVPILWVNWGNRPDHLNLSPSLLHVAGPDSRVLQLGEWGAAIVAGLATDPTDIHVAKYRMSGFWDTPLDSILRNLRVQTLLFAGVNLDQCVLCTLQDANFLGYDTILLEDCCATSSPDFCVQATLYNVKQIFGFVTGADALLAGVAAFGASR
jgi:ureidoacrylate peracid hydrolase